MLPLQSARVNPTSHRWSRFSEVESVYSQDFAAPSRASMDEEDLSDLVLHSQQALNVLRNEMDADSCFNFDDPDAEDGSIYYSEIDRNSRRISSIRGFGGGGGGGNRSSIISRRPSTRADNNNNNNSSNRRYSNFSSRFSTRTPYTQARVSLWEAEPPSPCTPSATTSWDNDSAAAAADGSGGVQRIPSIRRAVVRDSRSRRVSRPGSSSLGRNLSLLRRAASNRRHPSVSHRPLPPTKEAPEEDLDFEASLARLSSSSLLSSDPQSSTHSLALLLPGSKPPTIYAQPSAETLRNDDPRDQPGYLLKSYTEPIHGSDPATTTSFWTGTVEKLPLPPTRSATHVAYTAPVEWPEPTTTTQQAAAWASTTSLWRSASQSSTARRQGSQPGQQALSPAAPPAPPLLPPQSAAEGSPPGGGGGGGSGSGGEPMVEGSRIVAIGIALSLAVFLVGMDVNIISTAIPKITADFNSLDDITWYGSAFMMTASAFQIPFGRVYTLYSVKWVFVSVLVVFLLGSLVTALAPSSAIFIAGRAIQGVGASGLLSGALIIGSLSVPLSKRSLLGGVVGAMEGVAMISSPIIGGFFADRLTWRWCFYINLPVGAVVIVVIVLILRLPPKEKSDDDENMRLQMSQLSWLGRIALLARRLDVLGSAILMPAIVCALLGLQWGGTKYPWSSLGIILLFVTSAILLAIFMYMQHLKQDLAMVPPRIFKQRTILAGFWFMLCTSSTLVVFSYLLPLWYQYVLGVSSETSGIRMLPMLIGVIVAVLLSGVGVSIIGYYVPFMILGTVMMSLGAGLLSTLSPTTSAACLIVFPAIFGAGAGVAFQQPIVAAQTVLAPVDVAMGTSVIVFGQGIGGAIILSAAETVFSNRLAELVRNAVGVPIAADTSVADLAARFAAAGGSLAQLVDIQNKAVTQAMYVGVAMAVLSAVGVAGMEWKSVKKEELRRKEAALLAEAIKEKADPQGVPF